VQSHFSYLLLLFFRVSATLIALYRGDNKMWLDDYLHLKKIKASKFAAELGIHRNHLYDVIAGRKRAGPKLAKKIAKATNDEVKLTEILYGDRAQYAKPPEDRKGIL
jgi:hypothetical protein